MPAPPPGCLHTEFVLASSGQLITSKAALLYGWGIANTNQASPAQLDIYDGIDTNGPVVFPITLTTGPAGASEGESDRDYFTMPVWHRNGIYVKASVGAVKGTVLWLPA